MAEYDDAQGKINISQKSISFRLYSQQRSCDLLLALVLDNARDQKCQLVLDLAHSLAI
jgi:hypothetical protein